METVENGGLRKSGEDLSAVRANMDYSDDDYGIDYFDYRHDERKKLKCKCSKVSKFAFQFNLKANYIKPSSGHELREAIDLLSEVRIDIKLFE